MTHLNRLRVDKFADDLEMLARELKEENAVRNIDAVITIVHAIEFRAKSLLAFIKEEEEKREEK
jgi:hypothetical protein